MKIKNYLLLFCIGLLLAGCSPVRSFRQIAGISMYSVQSQKEKASSVIERDYTFCYEKTLAVLEEIGANPYLQNPYKKQIVAIGFKGIFARCGDSSKVGFFFEQLAPKKTKIIIKSQNTHLAEFVAQMLFEQLAS